MVLLLFLCYLHTKCISSTPLILPPTGVIATLLTTGTLNYSFAIYWRTDQIVPNKFLTFPLSFFLIFLALAASTSEQDNYVLLSLAFYTSYNSRVGGKSHQAKVISFILFSTISSALSKNSIAFVAEFR